MEIQLDSCKLRPWREGDEDSLVRHADDVDVWRNLRDRFPHPYTIEDAREWIELNAGQDPVLNFAIEVEGAAVGGIGLIPGEDIYRRTAELGYWLGRACWGRGIMTEAVRAMAGYAFTRLDLDRLFACLFPWNLASVRVLEKTGFRCEARLEQAAVKDGRTVDQLLYALVAEPAGRD